MEPLTKEERYLVARYLESGSTSGIVGWAVATIAPTALIFAYGVYTLDPVAIAVGYVGLLGLVIWYLSCSQKSSRHLVSALRKYEEATAATKAPRQGDA
jgi:hypothetical protein